LDIEAEFAVDAAAVEAVTEAEVGFNCSTSAGAAGRGMLGPFGLLVLADEDRSEQTAVYFFLAKGTDGSLQTFFCQDELRYVIDLYDARSTCELHTLRSLISNFLSKLKNEY
jgi:beta-fructofuranosidase